MNTLLKNGSLALILLTATFQNTPSPFDWLFAAWRFCSSQPQENSDQAPANVTIDNYIAQFRSDMNGQSIVIPWDEMQEMEAAIRKELRSIDLRDKNLANNIIRSVLCNQVKTGTIRDLDALKKEGFYITSDDYAKISSSNENNIIARLGRMPHLNGSAIAQYYGETRKHSLRNSLINRTSYR